MSDTSISGKILFGIDYLTIMIGMEYPNEGEKFGDKQPIIGAVSQFFLLQWGLSGEEVDKSRNQFFDKSNKGELEKDLYRLLDRVFNFVKNDRKAQEQLLLQILTLIQLDSDVTEVELFYANYFKERFDLKPSEFDVLVMRAKSWCMAIDTIGYNYEEYRKSHEVV